MMTNSSSSRQHLKQNHQEKDDDAHRDVEGDDRYHHRESGNEHVEDSSNREHVPRHLRMAHWWRRRREGFHHATAQGRARIILCVLFNLASVAFLYPGLTFNLLTVRILFGGIEMMSQTRSIIGTVKYLKEEGAGLAAGLIVVFSIAVPITKFIMLLGIACLPSRKSRMILYRIVRDWRSE